VSGSIRGTHWVAEDPLQAQRLKDEAAAQAQHEHDERHAQALQQQRDELARPLIEAQDQEFRERAERLLGPRLAALEARVAELERGR